MTNSIEITVLVNILLYKYLINFDETSVYEFIKMLTFELKTIPGYLQWIKSVTCTNWALHFSDLFIYSLFNNHPFQLKDSNDRPSVRRKRKEVKPSSIHRSLLCVIISGTILTTFIILYTDHIPWHLGHRAVDRIALSLGYKEPVHAIVIDAGSTGSRVLAFTFHKSYVGNYLLLDKELFVEVKPGLSSFADDPKKVIFNLFYMDVIYFQDVL